MRLYGVQTGWNHHYYKFESLAAVNQQQWCLGGLELYTRDGRNLAKRGNIDYYNFGEGASQTCRTPQGLCTGNAGTCRCAESRHLDPKYCFQKAMGVDTNEYFCSQGNNRGYIGIKVKEAAEVVRWMMKIRRVTSAPTAFRLMRSSDGRRWTSLGQYNSIQWSANGQRRMMNVRLSSDALTSAAPTISPTPSFAINQELLVNPGFERGTYGWRTLKGAVNACTRDNIRGDKGDSKPRSGRYMACFKYPNVSDIKNYVYQDVDLTAFTPYIKRQRIFGRIGMVQVRPVSSIR